MPQLISKMSAVSVPPPFRQILILGGGALAAELYAPAVLRLGWEREILFTDVSQRSIDVLSRAFPTLRTKTAGYAELIQNREFISLFGGAVIALPNHLHEQAVTACLKAGLDVLCEKPLALDAATCEQLASVAERTGRELSVAMVRRLIPGTMAIKNALQAGFIGEVQSLEIQHGSRFQWPSDSGAYFRAENGGLLVNMGVHYLDLIEDWIGPLLPLAYNDDYAGGAEANCDYRLRTSAGCPVRLKLSFTDKLENTITIRGTRGELGMDVNLFASFSWKSTQPDLAGTLHPQRPFAVEAWPLDFVSSFAQQFLEFQTVMERRSPVRVSARQAARTHELIDWAYSHRCPLAVKLRYEAPRPLLEPGKVTVTGGTGFVGDHLVERLHHLGFDNIVVPVRSYRSGARVARTSVERPLMNLLNYDSVVQAVAGSRYVFHLAHGGAASDRARVTLEGTKNIVEASIAQGVEAVVIASTVTVFGHPGGGRPVDETFPYQPALGDYGQSKMRAEKYCLERAKTSGRTRIVVINPGSIYGPGGRLFTSLPVRAVAEGFFGWIEGGSGKINYTFVENVVDALILAAGTEAAHGNNFIITDGISTFREFLTPLLGPVAEKIPSFSREQVIAMEKATQPGIRDLVRAMTGPEIMKVVNGLPWLSKPKKWIENRFAKAYAGAQTARASLHAVKITPALSAAGGPPPLWLADIYAPVSTEYSSAKARRVLGWSPLVSLEEGQRASRYWLGTVGAVAEDSLTQEQLADRDLTTQVSG